MIDLSTFVKNHFDTIRISNNTLKKFTESHIHRLAVNDPEEKYKDLLDAVKAANEAFTEAHVAEMFSEAQKEAGSVENNQYFNEYKKLISRKEGMIRGTWGRNSAVYQEFFPHGIDEYHQATKSNIEILMARFNAAVDDHAHELPAGFKEDFTRLTRAYTDSRIRQIHRKGVTGGLRSELALKRRALTKQLMVNLLTISIDYLGKPGALKVFFDQSLLWSRAKEPSPKNE